MRNRFVILPTADKDLDEQAAYLGENANLDLALRFYDAAESTFAFLAQTPEAGALRESENPTFAGLRLWRIKGFEAHLIFYRPTDDGTEIVRVLHGHRDIGAVFDDEVDR